MTKTKESLANHNLLLGKAGEDAAVSLLKRKGMRILERNWRAGKLEIDIIAQDSDMIVFVEVKTRKSSKISSPLDAVNYHKRQNLIKAAKQWLSTNQAWDLAARFDVVAIIAQNGQILNVEHISNAFEDFSEDTLHSCHTTW